jgi:hypothetical protein
MRGQVNRENDELGPDPEAPGAWQSDDHNDMTP